MDENDVIDTMPPGRAETAQDAPVTVIGCHAYIEHLGCEGRISYACDASGDVWRLEPGRRRSWFGRRSNWEQSFAARRIANPRTLPSDWDRPEIKRRVEGERV